MPLSNFRTQLLAVGVGLLQLFFQHCRRVPIRLRLRIGLDQLTLNSRDAEVRRALSLFQLRRDALLNVDARFRQELEQAACTCAFARLERVKVVRFRWLTLMEAHQEVYVKLVIILLLREVRGSQLLARHAASQ